MSDVKVNQNEKEAKGEKENESVIYEEEKRKPSETLSYKKDKRGTFKRQERIKQISTKDASETELKKRGHSDMDLDEEPEILKKCKMEVDSEAGTEVHADRMDNEHNVEGCGEVIKPENQKTELKAGLSEQSRGVK